MPQFVRSIAKIIDKTVLFFCLFFICFFICIKRVNNLVLGTVLSLILSSIINILLVIIFNKLKGKQTQSSINLKQIDNLINYLKFKTPNELKSYFINAFKANKVQLDSKIKSKIIIDGNNKIYFYYNFYEHEISLKNILTEYDYAQKHNLKLYYLANTFSKDAISFATSQPTTIYLLDKFNTFTLLKDLNAIPNTQTLTKQEKTKQLTLSKIITRKNSFYFFKLSIFFFIISFLLPLNGYYKTFGISFLILSILSMFFNKKYNIKQTFSISDLIPNKKAT